jgi:hypothetical protein
VTPFNWQWWRIAWSRRNRGGTILTAWTWRHVGFGLWIAFGRSPEAQDEGGEGA